MNCKAFTLAEVLITLGIIGIVAALTIPNLIIKYQKRATGARLKQAYAILMNTIRQSENEQGSPLPSEELEGYHLGSPDEVGFFKTYFVPYMAGATKVTTPSSMWSTVTPAGKDVLFARFYAGTYCINNGMCFYFMNHGSNYYYIVVDLNGPSKPNRVGHDTFYFALHFNSTKGAYVDGLTYSVNKKQTIDTLYSNYCNNTSTEWSGGAGCTELVIRNNWQIPDDKRYPY